MLSAELPVSGVVARVVAAPWAACSCGIPVPSRRALIGDIDSLCEAHHVRFVQREISMYLCPTLCGTVDCARDLEMRHTGGESGDIPFALAKSKGATDPCSSSEEQVVVSRVGQKGERASKRPKAASDLHRMRRIPSSGVALRNRVCAGSRSSDGHHQASAPRRRRRLLRPDQRDEPLVHNKRRQPIRPHRLSSFSGVLMGAAESRTAFLHHGQRAPPRATSSGQPLRGINAGTFGEIRGSSCAHKRVLP